MSARRTKRVGVGVAGVLAGWAALAAPAVAQADGKGKPQASWTVWAETVWTAAGDPIHNATVTIKDGRIASVTPGAAAPGDNGLRAAAITPGLIDASVHALNAWHEVEHEHEVSPQMRAADALELFDTGWQEVAASGVTTALVNPPDFDVIGGRGVVVKTGGGAGQSARAFAADAVLRGAMGSSPSARNHPAFGRPEDLYSRRPTTRMGVEWEHRRAFYEAAAARQEPERAFPGSDVLGLVLDGKLPFMVQAWTTQDIRTTVYLKEEIEREGLGQPRFIIDCAAEAWKEPQLLARSKVAVVLPPFPDTGRTQEGAFMALDTAKVLADLGIPIALSAHGNSSLEGSLARQASMAIRGGLSPARALEAVTLQPARLLGVERRVGSIEVGKDADLVLWSGVPFEGTSAVIGVLIDGRLIVDPRTHQPDTK